MGDWEQILKELAENDSSYGGFIKSALDEIESLRARVAELEAGMGEPVAWFDWSEDGSCFVTVKGSGVPLFRTPPTVAAALRKAAEVCDTSKDLSNDLVVRAMAIVCEEAIFEIPHDDSALREICMRVANEVSRPQVDGTTLQAIVDRVLGEKK